MYVVRLSLPDGRQDFKAFSARANAKRRFDSGYARISAGQIEGVALFEVPGIEDARAAVEAVKRGNANILDKDYNDELRRAADEFVSELIAKGEWPD